MYAPVPATGRWNEVCGVSAFSQNVGDPALPFMIRLCLHHDAHYPAIVTDTETK